MKKWVMAIAGASVIPAMLLGACSSNDNTQTPTPGKDSGATSPDGTMMTAETSTPDTGNPMMEGGPTPDAGFSLADAPKPNIASLKAGDLLLTASGETLALTGYDFPAKTAGDPVFADGWQVQFTHFIATFDKVTLSTNPETLTTDQSKVGALVAELDGPWAVDLHKDDPSYVNGKEQGERAVPFAVLSNQNKNGNAAFALDGTRYAVGFSAVTASAQALNVNLGPEALGLYQEMVQNKCVVLYVGTATYKGGAACAGPDAGADDAGELAKIPQVVNFHYCFKSPVEYINCDNQDNDPAPAVNNEPHQRGVAFKTNTYTTGEVTFHTDHPFWESTKHDTPARFDQMAAQAVGKADAGVPTLTLENMVGVDYTGFKDALGNPVPWRTCDPAYQNPNAGSRSGQMHFDPVAVPHATGNDPATGLRDYYDYSTYNQSTQGHWNGADGLCFVKRNYPSPP